MQEHRKRALIQILAQQITLEENNSLIIVTDFRSLKKTVYRAQRHSERNPGVRCLPEYLLLSHGFWIFFPILTIFCAQETLYDFVAY